jgi:transposase-like protein
MHIEIDLLPACPRCGAPMRLLRTAPQIGGWRERQTFECRLCGVAIAAEHALHFQNLRNPCRYPLKGVH